MKIFQMQRKWSKVITLSSLPGKGGSLIGAGLDWAQPNSLPQPDLYIWAVCSVSFLRMGCNGGHLGVTQPCFLLTHQIEGQSGFLGHWPPERGTAFPSVIHPPPPLCSASSLDLATVHCGYSGKQG